MEKTPPIDEDYMSESTWSKLGLDDRIISATKKLNWQRPTLVQDTAIPLAMAGKDVLVKAKTGSGKTGAYLIPLIQRLLVDKEVGCSISCSRLTFRLISRKE
jgi:ATP-dependent RNA helicase DDX56/DBP9